MTREIEVKKASKDNFLPYGKLIKIPDGGEIFEESKFWESLAEFEIEGGEIEVGIGITKSRPQVISKLEKHLYTPELLIPLTSDMIIPTYKNNKNSSKEDIDTDKIEAFLIKNSQAILINEGSWHLTPFPLKSIGKFMVVFKKNTPNEDLIFEELTEKVKIVYY